MPPTVVIDCFPQSVRVYRQGYAVVAIDVIRTTTSAVTAVSMGRRCFAAPSLEEALLLKARLSNPLLVGELAGSMPPGFDANNSPAELALRTDVFRPMILLSSSGTQLIHEAAACDVAYVACFRNYASVASHLAGHHPRIALIGAGSRGEFREEDQMCCGWLAAELMSAGYEAENEETAKLVERWRGMSPEACLNGKSAQYLRTTGQARDLDFILTHINDVQAVTKVERDEVVLVPSDRRHGRAHWRSADGKKDKAVAR